ncbi:MAG: SIS domain-containing protein [Dehalococcoidia bacterium]|nr:MAG: SIS domain-containing protein [Dehalococcoidia bacterium]
MDQVWARDAIRRISGIFAEFAAGEGIERLDAASVLVSEALKRGATVFWCGNGGSAGDAQHLAAELVGRFGQPGRGYPSMALTTDSSMLTAISNDFGFEHVFARQVEALAKPGDVVVGISTSGRSPNVVGALAAARGLGAHAIALTGPGASALGDAAEIAIRAPGNRPTEIQTCHIAIGQLMLERAIALAEA